MVELEEKQAQGLGLVDLAGLGATARALLTAHPDLDDDQLGLALARHTAHWCIELAQALGDELLIIETRITEELGQKGVKPTQARELMADRLAHLRAEEATRTLAYRIGAVLDYAEQQKGARNAEFTGGP